MLSPTEIIRVEHVTKSYRTGGRRVDALNGVDLTVYAGESLSLMGPSGSGKTTLFNIIGGLERPDSGQVAFEELRLGALDGESLADVRCNRIGCVFQSFYLAPGMSALDNVALPLLFSGESLSVARQRASDLLDLVNLDARHKHMPDQLSGGQQQRVAIARALANNPTVILADEPTGNLDLEAGRDIMNLLTRLRKEQGVTVLLATHDVKMVDASDRIAWMTDGRISRLQNRDEVVIRRGVVNGVEE